MFTLGIAMMNQLIRIFSTDPLTRENIGRRSFPDACRIAFCISTIQTKKDANPMMHSTPEPAGSLRG